MQEQFDAINMLDLDWGDKENRVKPYNKGILKPGDPFHVTPGFESLRDLPCLLPI